MTKKILSFCLSVVLLVSMMSVCGLVLPVMADESVTAVYVDFKTGDDTNNDGLSSSAPLKTLVAAFNKVNALGLTGDARKVHALGSYTDVSVTMDLTGVDAYTENITLTADSGQTIWFTSDVVKLGGPLTIDAKIGKMWNTAMTIYTYGYDLVLGENFVDSYYNKRTDGTIIYAGFDYATQAANTTVESGRYQLGRDNNLTIQGSNTGIVSIYYGNKASYGSSYIPVQYGDASLVIDNPNMTVNYLKIGNSTNSTSTDSTLSGGTYESQTVFNSLNIKVDNVAAITSFVMNSWQCGAAAGSLQAIFNNGTYDKITTAPTFNWSGTDWTKNGFVCSNSYVLKSDTTEGYSLDFTETVGTFSVAGDGGKSATAANTTNTYTSGNKLLTVGAQGVYDVTYSDPAVVYVDFKTGDDTNNDGLSSSAPLKTLVAAFNKVNALGLTGDARKVHALGSYTDVSVTMDLTGVDAYTENITLTADSGQTIWFTSDVVKLGGPLTIDAKIGKMWNTAMTIYTYGYDLVLGENFADSYYSKRTDGTIIYAGFDYATQAANTTIENGRYQLGRNNNLTIKGSNTGVVSIYYGNKASYGSSYIPVQYGDASLVIDNPNMTVNYLKIGNSTNNTSTDSTLSGGTYESQTVFNSLNIKVDNVAAITSFVMNSWQCGAAAGSLQAIFNNGTYDQITTAPTFNWSGTDWTQNGFVCSNSYVLKSDTTADCSLDFTETVGTFAVVGEKFATTTDGTNTYYSSNGNLTVPKGVYEVTYTDEVHEHSFAWAYDDTQHWKVCSCGQYEVEKTDHVFGDWTVTKVPTMSAEGEQQRSCVCGKVETETLPVSETPTAIYVDFASGDDANEGILETAPKQTLVAAFNKVNELGLTGNARRVIVMSSPTDVSVTLDLTGVDPYTENITLLHKTDGQTIWFSSDVAKLGGPLTIDAKIGKAYNAAMTIYTYGYDLVLGKKFEDSYYSNRTEGTIIYAGFDYATQATNTEIVNGRYQFGRNNNLTIKGSKTGVVSIYFGNKASYGSSYVPVQYGDANLVIDNPNMTVNYLKIGNSTNSTSTDTTLSEGKWEPQTRFNSLKIKVDQVAAITSFVMNSHQCGAAAGSVQAIFNNGTYDKITTAPTFNWSGSDWTKNGFVCSNSYVLKSVTEDGCYLGFTETVGTFTVSGGKRAIASGTTVSASSEGLLKISTAGEYVVTYTTSTLNGWYVNKTGGSDSNDGLTADTAFATLKKATAAADASSDIKSVVIMGEYAGCATSTFGTYSSMITITGYDESSAIGFGYQINVPGPTTFENIIINGGGNKFLTGGYEVVFGEGLTVNSLGVYVGGAQNTNLTADAKVTFLSGSYNWIKIGTYYNYERTEMAAVEVFVGKDVTTAAFEIGSDKAKDSSSVMREAGTDFNGDVKITLNGTVTGTSESALRLTSGAQSPRFKAGFQLIYNNNQAANKVFVDAMNASTFAEATITAPDGAWILKAGTDIYLTATDTLGTYTVEDGKLVVATDTSGNGNTYRSNNGKLVVPAGVYTVEEYTQGTAPSYNNYGDKVEVYEETEIDLSQLTPPAKPGYAFVGWTDAQGNKLSKTATCPAGTVLIPNYVGFDNSVGGDFSIIGAQMRTSGVQGLRFIIQQSDLFTAELETQLKAFYAEASEDFTLEQTAFGAVAIPSQLLYSNPTDGDGNYQGATWAELTVDTPNVATITAQNIYNIGDDHLQYTICLTGLENYKYYKRQYTVRGFVQYTVKYTDGTTQTVEAYTDEYSTNLAAVAQATIESGVVDSTVASELRKVITAVKEGTQAKYDAYGKLTVTDDTVASGLTLSDAPIQEGVYEFYQLGTDGLIIRDITIDADGDSTNNTAENATTIVQLSDTHLYYMNAEDWKNATLVGTEAARTWDGIKVQSNVSAMRKALDFAAVADQIVISGDVIDVLQLGALEVVQKEIINRYPQVLLANGNHDYIQACETYVGEAYDQDTRYGILNSAWASTYAYTSNGLGDTGDVSYASKIVNNAVMVIQIDDGQKTFLDGQAEKLEADLATARANGYVVLLFTHIPLYTNNPDETAVAPFYTGDNTSGVVNFYENSDGSLVGSPSMEEGSATYEVYNLITNNADIIRGVYNGHTHTDYYSEIVGTGTYGSGKLIPQYTMNGTTYGGASTKITVYSDAKEESVTTPVSTRVVTCWGDSITQGMRMSFENRYPTVLGELLGENYLVQNSGDPGETTLAIMARQGAIPVYTESTLTFAAGETRIKIGNGATHGLVTTDSKRIIFTPDLGNQVSVNDMVIGGNRYAIEIENFDWTTRSCDVYLSRKSNGAITIPAGTEVTLASVDVATTNYCDVYLMGANGGWDNDVNILVSHFQNMIAHRSDDNYLIVIPYWRTDCNDAFKTAFGDKAIDLIDYLETTGLASMNITLSDDDAEQLQNGYLPSCLTLTGVLVTEDVHMNSTGYRLLATAIYEAGCELGYWD